MKPRFPHTGAHTRAPESGRRPRDEPFRFGRLKGSRNPGLRLIIPFIDVLHRVSLRIVTMPIQSQGIITRDNVSVDVSGALGLAADCCPDWGTAALPVPDLIEEIVSPTLEDGGQVLVVQDAPGGIAVRMPSSPSG